MDGDPFAEVRLHQVHEVVVADVQDSAGSLGAELLDLGEAAGELRGRAARSGGAAAGSGGGAARSSGAAAGSGGGAAAVGGEDVDGELDLRRPGAIPSARTAATPHRLLRSLGARWRGGGAGAGASAAAAEPYLEEQQRSKSSKGVNAVGRFVPFPLLFF